MGLTLLKSGGGGAIMPFIPPPPVPTALYREREVGMTRSAPAKGFLVGGGIIGFVLFRKISKFGLNLTKGSLKTFDSFAFVYFFLLFFLGKFNLQKRLED